MSLPDRFEILEPLREGDVQAFRARERATGRIVEVHFLPPDQPSARNDVIEQGDHEGKRYVITAQAASAPLDSAGAWRIKTVPAQSFTPSQEPGDFTRMFELHQAPELTSLPVSKPVEAAPASTSEPGEFTRAFQRPAPALSGVSHGTSPLGEAGDFTRMFHKPVPQPPAIGSHPSEPGIESRPAAPNRFPTVFIVGAVVLLCAIAVLVLVRLY